jgi:hypothetical protein
MSNAKARLRAGPAPTAALGSSGAASGTRASRWYRAEVARAVASC